MFQVLELFIEEPELAHITLALLVGGRAIEIDVESIRKGAHLVVCTPGRLEDLLSERKQLNFAGRLKELVGMMFILYQYCRGKLCETAFMLAISSHVIYALIQKDPFRVLLLVKL